MKRVWLLQECYAAEAGFAPSTDMYTWSGELFITWHAYASLGMHCVQDNCLDKRLQVSRANSYCSRTSLKVTSSCTACRSPPSSFSLFLQEWHSISPWNIRILIFIEKVLSVISLKNTKSKQGVGSDFDLKEIAVILQQWDQNWKVKFIKQAHVADGDFLT